MKIYLDNCCYNRPFDSQNQIRIQLETQAKLFIQQKIVEGDIFLVWSYILEYENSENPFIERKTAIAKWKQFSNLIVEADDSILKRAKEIMKSGIKPKDALHIASAIESDCDFFITCDDDLLNKSKELKIAVVNPLQFITLYQEDEK
jgi:predicted nucleic acid-binding protein